MVNHPQATHVLRVTAHVLKVQRTITTLFHLQNRQNGQLGSSLNFNRVIITIRLISIWAVVSPVPVFRCYS
jgi:hypothetical protein